MVQHAISGMAAAACGLLVAMGVKMAWLHPQNPRTVAVALLAMAAIAGLGWPAAQGAADCWPDGAAVGRARER